MAAWIEIGCEDCGCAIEDDLARFPELPQHPARAVLWVLEHGCPDCGCLDVEVEAGEEVDDDLDP